MSILQIRAESIACKCMLYFDRTLIARVCIVNVYFISSNHLDHLDTYRINIDCLVVNE